MSLPEECLDTNMKMKLVSPKIESTKIASKETFNLLWIRMDTNLKQTYYKERSYGNIVYVELFGLGISISSHFRHGTGPQSPDDTVIESFSMLKIYSKRRTEVKIHLSRTNKIKRHTNDKHTKYLFRNSLWVYP